MIISVPGDKSITQRALLLAALGSGTSRLSGLLPGADPRSTAAALRRLGARIPELPGDGAAIDVQGRGVRGLVPSAEPLDLGNSGTGARLLLGVLAGQPFSTTVTGDASLRSRPMRRVTDPLALMGARIEEVGEPGRLPLRVHGGALEPLDYDLPVASAQVKSALLLAGLTGRAFVLLTEPYQPRSGVGAKPRSGVGAKPRSGVGAKPRAGVGAKRGAQPGSQPGSRVGAHSRDHTERMLRQMGVSVVTHAVDGGWRVEMRDPPETLAPLEDFRVPGDLSSAAFFLVLGALGGAGEELTVRGVGLNPTRAGILPILERMGVGVEREADPMPSRAGSGEVGEPTGTLTVRPGELTGTRIGGDEIPAAIDEIPILAVAAARAQGTTRITGAGELRVKETDRIRALAENLRAVGVEAEELEDGIEIRGSDRPLRGRVRSFDDHRIAMAFGVLGALPGNEIQVEGGECVDVSYPGFWSDLRRVAQASRPRPGGARADAAGTGDRGDPSASAARGTGAHPDRDPVVTLDGPAGSGKSTTAKEVARRLGFRHLDSGAFYRALTWALLDQGVDPAEWPHLTAEDLDACDVTLEPGPRGFRIGARGRPLDHELRTEEVTSHVSSLAKLPAVRDWLLDVQRRAGAYGRLVADGRDMGSVVFPHAEVKVFLVADLQERARRRLRDHGNDGPTPDEIQEEAARIEERDRADSEREHSPLHRPEDAHVLDTSALDFESQVQTVVELVQALRAGRPKS